MSLISLSPKKLPDSALEVESEDNVQVMASSGAEDLDDPKVDDDSVNLDDLLATIQQFLAAKTWNESQNIVELYPGLLSEEADRLLVHVG